jgi:two-component sensor histidine kinase
VADDADLRPGDAVDGLTAAIVASCPSPLVLLNEELRILAVSRSFCDAFEVEPTDLRDQMMSSLGKRAWNPPALLSKLRAVATRSVETTSFAMNLPAAGRKGPVLHVDARLLRGSALSAARIVLTITGAGAIKAAAPPSEGLPRETPMALRIVQHRIANNLQFISGMLFLEALKADTKETRKYLQDAYRRVMATARKYRGGMPSAAAARVIAEAEPMAMGK